MLTGPDVSSNQSSFDFNLAYAQGHRACYIKLGGENIPEYESASYPARFAAAVAAGFIVGSYWITGGHDPVQAAGYYCDRLARNSLGDFHVLDNETLDNGNTYNDAEAAAFIRTEQARLGGDPRRFFMYASESTLAAGSWAETRATGCQALVAWYGQPPLAFGGIGAWPAAQIGGHQYADNANVGGWPNTDLNAWKDDALTFTTVTGGGPIPITPIEETEEDDMATGYYAKGDKMPNTFWIDQTTGKRRPATAGELEAAAAFNAAMNGKFGNGYVATIPQADLDAIPYA
jgi:hypothetical protein